jgi:hypothetical protein
MFSLLTNKFSKVLVDFLEERNAENVGTSLLSIGEDSVSKVFGFLMHSDLNETRKVCRCFRQNPCSLVLYPSFMRMEKLS